MNITLTHDQGLKFTAQGESGFTVDLDASPSVGGGGKGFRPMELFLVALASCTSIDTVLILNKTRKSYRDYRVKVTAKRREEIPQFFTEINLLFTLVSEEISPDNFHRAVDLSLTKYCSVAEMIRPQILIRAELELNGKRDDRLIERKVNP